MNKKASPQNCGKNKAIGGQQQQTHVILQIWFKYIHLRKLVKKMDCLFGWITLLDYGIKLFMICFMSNTILHIPMNPS